MRPEVLLEGLAALRRHPGGGGCPGFGRDLTKADMMDKGLVG